MWTINPNDIRVEGDNRLMIAAKNGLRIPGTAAAKIEFELFGLQAGLGTVAPIANLPIDVQQQKYVIDTSSFTAFHASLKEAVIAYVKGSGKGTPPGALTLKLRATVSIDASTRVPVNADLPISINFVQKQ